jgi:23S rRNA pseudouridine1911/1915/1917 synthase
MLEILLDDSPCLAVNKPAGLLTQGPPLVGLTLETMVKQYLRETLHKAGNVYLGIPHRLDRAVSGVVIFSRNSKGAARLAELFRDRRVTKTYWAILEKCPEPLEGTLIDGIQKLEGVAYAELVPVGTPASKEGRLSYRVIREVPGGWFVEVLPETGRFHQIRVQFGGRGCPVVGDVLYGATSSIDVEEAGWVDDGSEAAPTPIALHSRKLELPHPIRFEPISALAPAPHYWTERKWFPEG